MPLDVRCLPPQTQQFPELLGWIDATHPGPISVLDVGGGGSFYDFPAALRGVLAADPRTARADDTERVRRLPGLRSGVSGRHVLA